VLAALRAGSRSGMLPARTRRGFEEIPEEARKRLEFVWLENVDDALRTAVGYEAARAAA
jgi:ATP-dependent Lon protease